MRNFALAIAIAFAATAHAQTYTPILLYSFPELEDGTADSPGSLIADSAGNMYTTACCTSEDFGSVIKITPQGVLTTLYTFTGGVDGGYPGSSLVRDSSGNLYGFTTIGGPHNVGTLFKLSSTLKETTIYSFNNVHPFGSLLRDSVGNFYGYAGVGTHERMYKLSAGGVYSTIYTFCSKPNCSDGFNPEGNPIIDKAGNLYGVVETGGTLGFGAIFKLTSKFKYSVLYSFTGGADGAYPDGKLTQNASGTMYGNTATGGQLDQEEQCGPLGCGTVFQITNSGAFSVLYSFTNTGDGLVPFGALTLDSAGNIYGVTDDITTSLDYFPTVFKITPKGAFTVMFPYQTALPGLVVDKSGNVFGSTGNDYYDGGPVIYELKRMTE